MWCLRLEISNCNKDFIFFLLGVIIIGRALTLLFIHSFLTKHFLMLWRLTLLSLLSISFLSSLFFLWIVFGIIGLLFSSKGRQNSNPACCWNITYISVTLHLCSIVLLRCNQTLWQSTMVSNLTWNYCTQPQSISYPQLSILRLRLSQWMIRAFQSIWSNLQECWYLKPSAKWVVEQEATLEIFDFRKNIVNSSQTFFSMVLPLL